MMMSNYRANPVTDKRAKLKLRQAAAGTIQASSKQVKTKAKTVGGTFKSKRDELGRDEVRKTHEAVGRVVGGCQLCQWGVDMDNSRGTWRTEPRKRVPG